MKCEKSKFVLLGVISWQYDVKIDQSSKIPLSKGKYTNGHANLLLYDRETNTVERFDSNVDTARKAASFTQRNSCISTIVSPDTSVRLSRWNIYRLWIGVHQLSKFSGT